MATTKFIELQQYTDEDLQNEINVTEEQYKKLKFDHAIRGLENPLLLKEVKKRYCKIANGAKKQSD